MPVTLRHVRPDLGAKLRQLEADTKALHEVARTMGPVPRRHPAVRLLNRIAVWSWGYVGRPAYRAVGSALALAIRSACSPHLAAALRYFTGSLSEGIRHPLSACAIFLALALLVLLIAPAPH